MKEQSFHNFKRKCQKSFWKSQGSFLQFMFIKEFIGIKFLKPNIWYNKRVY